MADTIISVENLGKRYTLRHQNRGYETLRETIARKAKGLFMGSALAGSAEEESFWALQDVSFEIQRGDVVGIIGRNGAGKSTLLKILSRITEPTRGRIRLRGRVASLLEVGTGFHPELTGRENIYLNGAILGMTKAEIRANFDEIVAFADVERFLDTPVKHYSSGMYVRLAFAVAAHLEPEILIVDEVLAVGDAQFQKKCLGKMGEVAAGGKTVLFVTHSVTLAESLCTNGLLLAAGQVVCSGPIRNVLQTYAADFTENKDILATTARTGNGSVVVRRFWIEDAAGNHVASSESGADTILAFECQAAPSSIVRNIDIGIALHTARDELLTVLYSSYTGDHFDPLRGTAVFRCKIKRLPLSLGTYRVTVRVLANGEEADWPRDGVGFLEVRTGMFYRSGHPGFEATSFLLDAAWTCTACTNADSASSTLQASSSP